MNQEQNGHRPLQFVYTVNDDFLKFALTSIASVLQNRSQPCAFHIVHDSDISQAEQSKATQFIESLGGDVDFHTVPAAFPRQFAAHTTWDVSVLYRLALSQILPDDIGRVVYLDSDTLVRRPLDELFEIDLGTEGLAAVPEDCPSRERLGLAPNTCYLNSGVLAIDLDVWRRNRTCEQLLDLVMLQPDRWVYPDQDILAVHFNNNWTRLKPEFNVTHRFFLPKASLPVPAEQPHLIHFAGQGCKPWQTHREHPYGEEFWSFANQVLEAGFAIPDRPVKTYRWYQRGLIAGYRERQIVRRKKRREAGKLKQIANREAFDLAQQEMVTRFAADLTVRRGPFQSMRYPDAYSHGSTLSPKLLGTYEAELHPILERLLTKKYPAIIDVGGAEGYYAIGAALRWKSARIIAYELQREARVAIAKMATINGVADRIRIEAECMFGDLYGQRALVICDIEGCEADLLVSSDATLGFADSDFLIETHDVFRPGICKRLEAQFSQTHDITIVDSILDANRPAHWKLPELAGVPVARQAEAMAEGRRGPMQWLICESRNRFPTRQVEPLQTDSADSRAA